MEARPLFEAPPTTRYSGDLDPLAHVAEYNESRSVQRALNGRLTKMLTESDLGVGAHRLGLLQPNRRIVFGSEDETSVLIDFCIYDVRRNAKNAIDRLVDEGVFGGETVQGRLLAGMASARFSLFKVERTVKGIAIDLRDLLYGDRILVIDQGLAQSISVNAVLAGRVVERGPWWMCTGASLPVRAALVGSVRRAIVNLFGDRDSPKLLVKEETAELGAVVLGALLKAGAADEIRYLMPASATPNVGGRDRSPGR